VTDSIALEGSCANITRTLSFQNETVISSMSITNNDQTVENFYGTLFTDLSVDKLGIRTTNYNAYFNQYPPTSLQVNIVAPWNLIFSGSLLPSLSNTNCLSVAKPLQFEFVEPLLWVGVLVIVPVALMVLALLVRRHRLLKKSRKTNTRFVFQGTESSRGALSCVLKIFKALNAASRNQCKSQLEVSM
jgi:hypothetical protein